MVGIWKEAEQAWHYNGGSRDDHRHIYRDSHSVEPDSKADCCPLNWCVQCGKCRHRLQDRRRRPREETQYHLVIRERQSGGAPRDQTAPQITSNSLPTAQNTYILNRRLTSDTIRINELLYPTVSGSLSSRQSPSSIRRVVANKLPTRGGPPAWGLGEVLTYPHC